LGLSEVAEEFRHLDGQRKTRGLSMAEAERYHSLYERLSELLVSNERHRKVDARQFLRVKFPMAIVIRTPQGEVNALCHDFGGGGCAVNCSASFKLGDDVWLDGAIVGGQRVPLHGRSVVAWTRLPSNGSSSHGFGLRFAIDSPSMRDQIDRLLYRVLDLFLKSPEEQHA
jgi:Tfp pilus assembly protein PilZ